MNNNELELKYKQLILDVQTNPFYTKIDLTNRVNCYICRECGHVTKTKDVDRGVTPFYHLCEKCGLLAKSTFYKDIVPDKPVTEEWYRPTLEQVLKMDRNSNMLDHILNGGLDVRKTLVQPKV